MFVKDAADSTAQTTEHKSYLTKTYSPDRLFTVVHDFSGSQLYDLSLKKGSVVGIIKEVDPMGNRDRWFVDNGGKYCDSFIPVTGAKLI